MQNLIRPNPVEARGLILHVGISLWIEAAQEEAKISGGTTASVWRNVHGSLSFPLPYSYPTQVTGEMLELLMHSL